MAKRVMTKRPATDRRKALPEPEAELKQKRIYATTSAAQGCDAPATRSASRRSGAMRLLAYQKLQAVIAPSTA